MSYKNSVKLLASNFSIVYKQLLYMIVVVLSVFGLTYAVSQPIINVLDEAGVISEFSKVFESIYTAPKEVLSALTNASTHLLDVLNQNLTKLLPSFIGVFVFLFVLYQILKNISIYNITSLMFMKMTSFTKLGYTRNLISTLYMSFRFSLVKLIMKIPFVVLKAIILICFFRIVRSPLSIILGLFVVILLLILLSSLELLVFSGMAGKMLEQNCSAFKGFFAGCVSVFKKFSRGFSNSLIAVLTLVVVNLFFGLFTFGVGLLITIPASMLFISIFQLATYFGAIGERYYLTKTIVITPLGEENKFD